MQIIIAIIALAAASIMLALAGIVFWFFSSDLVGYELPVFGGIAVPVGAVLTGFLLDRSDRLSRKCQLTSINLKWLVITLVILLLFVGVFLVSFLMAGFDLATFDVESIDLSSPTPRSLVIFAVIAVVTALPCPFIYFGLKTIRASKHGGSGSLPRSPRGTLVKSSTLAAVAMLFMVAGGFAIDLFTSNLVTSKVQGGNGHVDGPWLTWDADPRSSICITWLTATPNSTLVKYGTSPGMLNMTYQDASLSKLHKARLVGLSPDTTYYYWIPEIFETPHNSTQFNFTTAPNVPRPFKFAVFGDMQPDSPSSDIMRTNGLVIDGLLQRDIDFAVQVGDIASSGSSLSDWHLSFTSLARLGAHVPLQNTIGNHDWSGMAGALNWRDLFSYPYAGGPLSQYYSYDYLNAHFVVIDNFERLYAMSQRQLRWIEDDITAARARGQDWIFCFFHLSIMTTSTTGMLQGLQRVLVPLFDRLAVDAVFYGHDHDYQHYNYTYGWNGLVYEPGHAWTHHPVQYFMTGGGGANLEVGYGVLSQGLRTDTVRWWNTTAGSYQDKQYTRHPWNASRYVTNPGFPVNYTQYSAEGTHDGKYYYHYPPHQAYHDEHAQLGFQYGEQAFHFIEVSIDGNTCNITARYPNGVMLAGPGGIAPQSWVFVKP